MITILKSKQKWDNNSTIPEARKTAMLSVSESDKRQKICFIIYIKTCNSQ